MKLTIATSALLFTSTALAYSFDDCYKSNIGWICEDFCGPGRHFHMDDISEWCSLSRSDQTSYLSIADCRAFDSSYCDYDWLNGQFDTDPEGLRENICERHCDKGITAGGGLQNCHRTSSEGWACKYRDEPLPEVPAQKSHLVVFCPYPPAVEPRSGPGGCTCEIRLTDYNEPYDPAFTCSSCEVVPDTVIDGAWNNYWDCSNLLTGDCVGVDENGCVSNIGDPTTIQPTIGPPMTIPQEGPSDLHACIISCLEEYE